MAEDLLLPPKDQERLVNGFLDLLDGEAETSKHDAMRSWEDSIRQVRGDQWRLDRSPYFLANVIRNQVNRKVGTLTEAKPTIRIQPLRGDLSKSSAVIYNVAKSILDRESSDASVARAARFAMTLGSAFFYLPYDALNDEIHFGFLDPRRVFLDPAVTDPSEMESVGQYCRIDTVLPLWEIRRRFPGRGALVKADERYAAVRPSRFPGRRSLLASVMGTFPRPFKPGFPVKSGPIPRALVKEYWVRDPQMNLDGGLLFPGGRHIVRSSDIVLLDEANPYWDGGWPIEMFGWEPDFDQAWGLGEIDDLRRLQEAVNRMGDSWVRNVLLGSNFRVIADLDALDEDQWDKLDNEAGIVIRKKPQRNVDYQAPIEMGQTVPNTIGSFIQLMDMLTGNMDTQGGKSPATESTMVEGLQMARQTLIRAVARRLESTLQRVGQKLIARIFQYATADTVYLQLGPSREWVSYAFERLKLVEKDDGTLRAKEELQKAFREYRFLVTPGSSLAVSRIHRGMSLLQLRSATGVVPSVKRILTEFDIGDPDALLTEGLEELKTLPPPPPAKGRGGKT